MKEITNQEKGIVRWALIKLLDEKKKEFETKKSLEIVNEIEKIKELIERFS